jgi:AhpD family alkylhydroperoxidase
MEAGRLNAYKAAPDAMRAVQRVESYIQQCGLEKSLIELVKMRASQINGCAYCLHHNGRLSGAAVPRESIWVATQMNAGSSLCSSTSISSICLTRSVEPPRDFD